MAKLTDAVYELLPLADESGSTPCRCDTNVEADSLRVDAVACPGGGVLSERPDCRETIITAIGRTGVSRVLVECAGRETTYFDDAGELLASAARFADRVEPHDEWLAVRARRKPLAAAADARGRAEPIRSIAVDSGLLAAVGESDRLEELLRLAHCPTVSDARIVCEPPVNATLREQRELSTGAIVRRFDRPGELPLYHLEPVEARLDDDALAILDSAATLLSTGAVSGEGAARRAVARTVEDPVLLEPLGAVLEKHTADLGILVDCFADPAVSDVFATPPIADTPLRVRVDGDLAATNLRLSERGARALASTFRLQSGRAFSRADPMLDATATAGDRRVRVAGTTAPVSDGLSFAIRAHDREPWTLADLVANGTLPPAAAGLLSVAVERDPAILVAGPRGAGKTTLLGALLFELPQDVRTLLIEDTPELPVEALQSDGRDVHTLNADTGDGPGVPPADVLRSALRLGEGALVVGEVRGEEASVLYEAMRVGASDSAVLGTIHGKDAESVEERLVSDLGVPTSSFATTDIVVSVASESVDGERGRHLADVEEVIASEEGVRFASLFDHEGTSTGGATTTGRIDRGRSHFIETIATPAESYADVRALLERRESQFATTAPGRAGHQRVDDRARESHSGDPPLGREISEDA